MSDNSCTTSQLSSDPKNSSTEPLWEFIPISDYEIPSIPVRSGATRLWESFRQLFRHSPDPKPGFLSKPEKLQALPPEHLSRLVPLPDWSETVEALETTLQGWMSETDSSSGPCFVIGQPFSGNSEILSRWAVRHGAVCIQAPTYEQIRQGDAVWIKDLFGSIPLSVLPDLEHWFLRHVNGLNLVRQLWEELESSVAGKVVIGCDSWAWAYLNRVWAVPHSDALTLKAFDGARLQRFFSRILHPMPHNRIRFRDVSTGNDLWCVPAETEKPTEEMIRLAAYCRGNALTALYHWRKRLVSAPEGNCPESEGETPNLWTDQPGEISLWVSDIPPEPVWPGGNEEEEAMLLTHALLVHGGLPEYLFPDLLPISETRCSSLMQQLRRSQIVDFQNGRWSVREFCYPAVRNRLRTKEYLVDWF